ncbi:MAG: eL32 family ribosomal protein [Candidatus Anstonellaceae archaeon]
MVAKRKHPKFLRPNYGRSKRSRIKPNWRRPRGIDNKKRQKIKYMGASPSIGYRQPKKIRNLHPTGLPEVLINSPLQIKGLKDVVVRIAHGVGKKKRQEIVKLCKESNLKILNAGKKEMQPAEGKKPEGQLQS